MNLRARTAALAAGTALAGCTVTVETPVPEQFLLPDREAFAVAAEHEVRSTSTLETAAFNALLKEARGEPWLEESMTVVERFADDADAVVATVCSPGWADGARVIKDTEKVSVLLGEACGREVSSDHAGLCV